MPSLRIDNFYGIVPRLHPVDLKPGYAVRAEDVRLTHGTLMPWRERLPVADVPAGSLTVEPFGCGWLAWDKCVEVAPWLPHCNRLFVTGDAPYPTVGRPQPDGTFAWCRLGVPCPGAGPIATPVSPLPAGDNADDDAALSNETEGRDYLATYVNAWCEEGGPSWPGNEFICNDGDTVIVTGLPPTPDPEWCVTGVNLYRRVTGFRTGREQVEEHITSYCLVATLPVGTPSYTDSTLNMDLGAVLTTLEFMPPPACLRGILAIPETGTLVGFCGCDLFFSANGQPWNWPEAERMTLDYPIVSLRALDVMWYGATIFAATTGTPYTIQGTSPGCKKRECRRVRQYVMPFPMVTCCSNRGSVVTPMGMVYVSTDGLVLLPSWGQPKVITDQWFAQDDWRKLRPDTMRLGWYAGTLFCVSDSDAFMLTIDTEAYSNWETYRLSSLSDRPVFLCSAGNGELFMLNEDGTVSQWNAGTTLRPYEWESKWFESPGQTYFLAGRVWCNGEHAGGNCSSASADFALKADQRIVFHRIVAGHDYFRIKPYGRHMIHGVILRGTGTVWAVHVATSLRELALEQHGR
ncbi:hypothetical protein [Paraburkholderia dinghuensis]|uniref:Uncharacterized protein n=1 Tax=Paraburkholderia dinghuensis TaxID=2305225 RepID=A0A3N6P031_9BURK|nr:hypothetical protein [Paraburkholderia dinghuensis]RQH06623.1 hypothetical protein D1Y85_12180 [Paraburkholderia dinghuensis]